MKNEDISNVEVGKRITAARERAEMSKKELAEKVQVAESTIGRYEKGTINKIKIPIIKSIANALNISPLFLTGKIDIMIENETPKNTIDNLSSKDIKFSNIPILGEVACGLPLFAEQNIVGYTYTDKKDHVDFALYANGDSMNAARIVDGDLVYIRQQNIVENGEIALVLVDDLTATIKRFYDYGDKVVLRPDSFNSEHKEQVYEKSEHNIIIQGKVIFIKTFIK